MTLLFCINFTLIKNLSFIIVLMLYYFNVAIIKITIKTKTDERFKIYFITGDGALDIRLALLSFIGLLTTIE